MPSTLKNATSSISRLTSYFKLLCGGINRNVCTFKKKSKSRLLYHYTKLHKRNGYRSKHHYFNPIVDDIVIYCFLSAQQQQTTSINYLIYMVYPAAYNSKFLPGELTSHMNQWFNTYKWICLSCKCKDVKVLLKTAQYFSDLWARRDLLLCNTKLYVVFTTYTLKSSKSVMLKLVLKKPISLSTQPDLLFYLPDFYCLRFYDALPAIKNSLNHNQVFLSSA